MIKSTVLAHSLSPQGDELLSVLVTFPRIILAEVNTHRMLSKNTSSSRAIPFNKMVEAIENNPFIPIAWQKEHKGMQGTEYHTEEDSEYSISTWLDARDRAVQQATLLNSYSTTKQLCNRLLEPFMWTTMLITGNVKDGGWDNFFNLRCPQYEIPELPNKTFKSSKDVIAAITKEEIAYYESACLDDMFWLQHNKGQAEIHMMALAEAIYDSWKESTPRQLEVNEWHIPFWSKIPKQDVKKYYLANYQIGYDPNNPTPDEYYFNSFNEIYIKISTAMTARTSYTVVGDEKEIDYNKMIELHDRLVNQNPPHSSPMEHCARAMNEDEYNLNIKGEIDLEIFSTEEELMRIGYPEYFGWCRNFKGFIQHRHIIENAK